MIYLASPYTHHDPFVQSDRLQVARAAAAHFIALGKHVFSPIVYGVAIQPKLTPDYNWRPFDLNMLNRCDTIWVLCLPGWRESKGVQAEISAARLDFQIPIRYVDPQTYAVSEKEPK